MKRLLGRLFFALLFIGLSVSTVTVVVLGIGTAARPVVDRVFLEAGYEMPDVADFLKEGVPAAGAYFVSDMTLFGAKDPVLGEFELKISVGGRIHTTIIEIADTRPPTGTFINRVSIAGEELLAADFVRDIQDATPVRVDFDRAVDFYQLGEQAVWVTLRDSGGNKTQLVGALHVLAGARTVYIPRGWLPAVSHDDAVSDEVSVSNEVLDEVIVNEVITDEVLGETLEDVLLRRFIFDRNIRKSAAFITDLDKLCFNTPGRVAVDIWVLERPETFFIEITEPAN